VKIQYKNTFNQTKIRISQNLMFKINNNVIFRQFENILYFEIFKCLVLGLVRFGFGLCRKIAVWFSLGLNFSYWVWLGLGCTLRIWFGFVLKIQVISHYFTKLFHIIFVTKVMTVVNNILVVVQ
jgi:hypothetical protein